VPVWPDWRCKGTAFSLPAKHFSRNFVIIVATRAVFHVKKRHRGAISVVFSVCGAFYFKIQQAARKSGKNVWKFARLFVSLQFRIETLHI